MITDQQYQDWLIDDGAARVVLVEATYDGGVEYFASAPYITGPTDTDPNRPYDDLLLTMGDIVSRVDRALDVGDLVLINDGSLDAWLTRAWAGQPLRLFLGDLAWSRDDFRVLVDGINGGLEAPRSNRIELVFHDQAKTLDQPLQTVKLADNTPAPVCLGEAFNVPPVLIDAGALTYQVHDGAVTSIAVRDNGVAVSPTFDLANGKFTLAASPAGTLTCDVVQADNTAAEIVTELSGRAGATVDTADLVAYPNTDSLGWYCRSEKTVLAALREILEPLGTFARFNTSGELQLVRIDAPGTSVLTLTEADILQRGVRLLATEQPVTEVVLGYQRNWQPQTADSLAGSVSDANKKLYGDTYGYVNASNTLPAYPLAEERKVDTLLADATGAQSEADRRKTLRSVKRERWEVKCFPIGNSVQLGDTVTVDYPGYGFAGGVDAVVVSIAKNPMKRRTTLEVFL